MALGEDLALAHAQPAADGPDLPGPATTATAAARRILHLHILWGYAAGLAGTAIVGLLFGHDDPLIDNSRRDVVVTALIATVG